MVPLPAPVTEGSKPAAPSPPAGRSPASGSRSAAPAPRPAAAKTPAPHINLGGPPPSGGLDWVKALVFVGILVTVAVTSAVAAYFLIPK